MGLQAVVYAPGPQTIAASGDSFTASGALLSFAPHDEMRFDANVTVATGTAPTVTFTVEHSPDGGATWFSCGSTGTVAGTGQTSVTLTAKGSANSSFGLQGRIRWTVTGTTPSITFNCWMIGK